MWAAASVAAGRAGQRGGRRPRCALERARLAPSSPQPQTLKAADLPHWGGAPRHEPAAVGGPWLGGRPRPPSYLASAACGAGVARRPLTPDQGCLGAASSASFVEGTTQCLIPGSEQTRG